MNKESKDCYIGERNGVISTLPDETDTTDAYVDVGKIDLLSPLMSRGYLTLYHINSKMPLEENCFRFLYILVTDTSIQSFQLCRTIEIPKILKHTKNIIPS